MRIRNSVLSALFPVMAFFGLLLAIYSLNSSPEHTTKLDEMTLSLDPTDQPAAPIEAASVFGL